MSARYSKGTNAYAQARFDALNRRVDVVKMFVEAYRTPERRGKPITRKEREMAERLIAAE